MRRQPASLQSTLNQLTKQGYRIATVEVSPDGGFSISTTVPTSSIVDDLEQARATRNARQAHRTT